jgi:excisionase family DNA binding protein
VTTRRNPLRTSSAIPYGQSAARIPSSQARYSAWPFLGAHPGGRATAFAAGRDSSWPGHAVSPNAVAAAWSGSDPGLDPGLDSLDPRLSGRVVVTAAPKPASTGPAPPSGKEPPGFKPKPGITHTMKVTVPEAARRVGRSPETVRRWIWSRRLPSEKVGNQHLVDTDLLDALVSSLEPSRDRLAEVEGEWSTWLEEAAALRQRLRAAARRFPPAADLVAESRRNR